MWESYKGFQELCNIIYYEVLIFIIQLSTYNKLLTM